MDTSDTELARTMRGLLKEDPEFADALAQRILRSSLADQMPGSADAAATRKKVCSWILENPADAGFLAVGFARDDRENTHEFEESLYKQIRRYLELNEDRDRGILGRLKAAGGQSRRLVQDLDMDDDQRRELLQRMFEGSSGGEGRVRAKPGAEEKSSSANAPSRGSSYAGASLYDRLSAANLSGYSPQVQALQSELNRSRPPGAPKLVETGKLDAPTLRQPSYSLNYDADTLGSAWRIQRAWAMAQSLGEERRYTPELLKKTEVQDDLERRAKEKRLPDSFSRRKKALDEAARAIRDFDAAARKAEDPRALTQSLLLELSALRRNAARALLLAALEEDLARLEQLQDFYSPAFVEAVRRCPVESDSQGRLLEHARNLRSLLRTSAELTQDAQKILSSPAHNDLLKAESKVAQARARARDLSLRVARCENWVQACANASAQPKGWRAAVERLLARMLPKSAAARRLQGNDQRRLALSGELRRMLAQDAAP